jgi:hypothetical protein
MKEEEEDECNIEVVRGLENAINTLIMRNFETIANLSVIHNFEHNVVSHTVQLLAVLLFSLKKEARAEVFSNIVDDVYMKLVKLDKEAEAGKH